MRKNKKLIIIVASLMVVIGVSFAYFSSTLLSSGSGSKTEFTTAKIQSSELKVEGTLTFNDLNIYPGHQNVSSVKVTATGDNELIPYDLIYDGTNTLNTPLNYTIYKTSNEVSVTVSCDKTKGVVDGALMYYEECSTSNIDSLGTPIATGTINSGENKTVLVSDEFITSSPTGLIQYYYIILEYPNLDENQNSDIGGSFSGKVTVGESDATPDINIVAAYVKQEDGTYEEVADIPQSGYQLNAEKSVCSNGATVRWENSELITSNLTKSGTECYLYFDEYVPPASETILANYSTVLTRTFPLTTSSKVETSTTGTIYKSANSAQHDDYGEVYYFAGNPTDNWVKFAEFYWRIIRINGDGSIRMIYQGTSANATGTGTRLSSESAFNSSYDRSEYVGLKYATESQRGTSSNSTILKALNNWYISSGLSGSDYADDIDSNVGFCGDRNMASGYSWSSQPSSTIYYAAYGRLVISSNVNPTFKCGNSGDLYKIPVGLITADEVIMAGLPWSGSTESNYLYTGQTYWTMSPYRFDGSSAYVFYVHSNGYLGHTGVNNARGVRPVINLKASVTITGGTGIDFIR